MLSARLPRHVIERLEGDERRYDACNRVFAERLRTEGPGRFPKLKWQSVEYIWYVEDMGAYLKKFGPWEYKK